MPLNEKITEGSVKTLVNLLKSFKDSLKLTPAEYVDKLLQFNDPRMDQSMAKIFLYFKKYEQILDIVLNEYSKTFDPNPADQTCIKVMLFLTIFCIGDENLEDIFTVLTKCKISVIKNLRDYFYRDQFLVIIAQAGCCIFDNEHVLNEILKPMSSKLNLLNTLCMRLGQFYLSKTTTIPKPLTVPVPPACSKHRRKIPKPPLNSPVPPRTVARQVPRTTYLSDEKLYKDLNKAFEENRNTARKLLEEAQISTFRCYEIKQAPEEQPLEPVKPIKPKKVPDFTREVPVKSNAAALMREAAVLVKDQEKELKKYEDIISGGLDLFALEEREAEFRREDEEEKLREIQRKHLKGLLTYEEAIAAKKVVIKQNKEKTQQIKEEKEELNKQLEEWQEEEKEKIKVLVKRSQDIEKAAKEAEKKMQEDKYKNAKTIEAESKQLLEEAVAEQERELNKKIQLIKEIRALESVKIVTAKEFDPTECPNFGFLCEMSIFELNERLTLMKIEYQQELEERRKAVLKFKKEREDLINTVENFVKETKKRRPVAKKTKVEVSLTDDIIELKNKLLMARKMREEENASKA